MFILKEKPILTKEGQAKQNVVVANGVLSIKPVDNNELKYENDKWYTLGEDGKWYFLGFGAMPGFETDTEGVIDQEIFDNIFVEHS